MSGFRQCGNNAKLHNGMQSMRKTCQAGTNEDRRSAVSSQELIFWGNWRNFDRTRITGRYIKIAVSSRSVVAVSIKQLVNRQKTAVSGEIPDTAVLVRFI